MKFLASLTGLVACSVFCLADINSQTIHSGNLLQGNEAVSIEKFEWIADKQKPSVAVRFILKNNTDRKIIKSVQFTLIAQNDKGVILQNGSSTLRKLSDTIRIAPNETGTVLFDKAFTIGQIDKIELKQAIVQFTNGSLEVLSR